MKLFALAAATAVDANPWPIRVMTPAPGIVNEQGGYWADQPTHPQAPQENYQVHQPYVQKPQCCEGYTWLSPTTNDQLWMRKWGEHDSKPYYKATDNSGVEKFLYWAWNPGQSGSVPPYALQGHWYVSSSLGAVSGVDTESQMTHGLRRCPQDYQSTPFTANMQIRCDQQPPQTQHRQPRQCCRDFEWTSFGVTIQMKDLGKKKNGRQVYEGVFSGTSQVIYFEAASPGSSSGKWVLSTSLTSIGLGGPPPFIVEASKTFINGFDTCPTDQSMWSPTFGTLQCKQPPPPPPQDTCEDVVDISFFTRSSGNFDRCGIEYIMRDLVRKQLTEFMTFVRQEGHYSDVDKMNEVYGNIPNAWEAMARGKNGMHNCGFKGELGLGNKNPKVANCDDFCKEIKDLHDAGDPFSRQDMIPVLEEFLKLVETEFDNSKSFKIF